MTEERLIKIEGRVDNIESSLNRLVNQMEKLITAFEKNYEADHKIEMSLQLINQRVEAKEEAVKRAHTRLDSIDAGKNKIVWAVMSAVGMAVLGLVLKVNGV